MLVQQTLSEFPFYSMLSCLSRDFEVLMFMQDFVYIAASHVSYEEFRAQYNGDQYIKNLKEIAQKSR